MRPNRIFRQITALMLLGVPLLAGGHGYRVGDIIIRHPWAMPSHTLTGTGYLTLRNQNARDDRLIAVSAAIADQVELVSATQTDSGENAGSAIAIPIAAGQEVRLQPGGPHIRFSGLHKPLTEGDWVAVTLRFQHAGETTVEMVVQPTAKDSVY